VNPLINCYVLELSSTHISSPKLLTACCNISSANRTKQSCMSIAMASTESKTKNPLLAHDGYIYRFDQRSADNGKYWRCMKVGCYGRIKTDDDDVLLEFRNTRHNHRPYPDTVDLERVVTAMQQSPEPETAFVGDIDCQESGSLSDLPAFAAVPSFTKVNFSACAAVIVMHRVDYKNR